mmetsp:Transcript_22351/g.35976  ORF Transcript_22351/g.35976 Transcript_22351/m.35976 type:complete len:105 (+) Transcript_22351:1129-1443(+)
MRPLAPLLDGRAANQERAPTVALLACGGGPVISRSLDRGVSSSASQSVLPPCASLEEKASFLFSLFLLLSLSIEFSLLPFFLSFFLSPYSSACPVRPTTHRITN